MYKKEDFVTKLLAMMRYAYLLEGRLPSGINVEEWEGDAENPGLKHQVQAYASELRREAFFAGYLAGARDTFQDISPSDKVFLVDLNRYGADKAWTLYDKD